MLNFLFTILFIFGLLIIFGQNNFFKISQFRYSPVQYVCNIFFIIFSYVGFFTLFYQLDSYRVKLGIDDPNLVAWAFIYSLYSIITFNLIYTVLLNKYKILRHTAHLEPNNKLYLKLCLGLSIGVFALFITIQSSGDVPLFQLLKGNVNEALRLRLEADVAELDYKRVLKWLRKEWLLLLAMIVLGIYCNTGKGKLLLTIAVLTLLVNSLLFLEKSQFVYVLLSLLGMFVYCSDSKKLILKIGITATIIVFGLLSLYSLLMNTTTIVDGLKSIIGRATTAQLLGAITILEIFPEKLPYLTGEALPNPGGLTPFGGFDLDRFVQREIRGVGNNGLTGTSPTIYWGNLYANFGVWGVLIAPFLAALTVFVYQSFISICVKSEIYDALLIWFAFKIKIIAMGSLNQLFINIDFVLLLLFVALLFGARRLSL
jgi:oligosaccharide repeat unit polymerase